MDAEALIAIGYIYEPVNRGPSRFALGFIEGSEVQGRPQVV